jgi:hypothetical protein
MKKLRPSLSFTAAKIKESTTPFFMWLSPRGDEQPLAPRAGSLLMRNAPSQTLLGDESERGITGRYITGKAGQAGNNSSISIHTRGRAIGAE